MAEIEPVTSQSDDIFSYFFFSSKYMYALTF